MQDMNAIYKKYSEIVYKYVFCLTGDENTTEEIVQETFLVAVKDINKFRGECKISTWLCQISKYIWYKRLKKEKSKKEIPLSGIIWSCSENSFHNLTSSGAYQPCKSKYLAFMNRKADIFKCSLT